MPVVASRATSIMRACDYHAADSCRHPAERSRGKRFLLARGSVV